MVEKALSNLQSSLIAAGGGSSRSFQTLIRSIGEAKTRDEEDRIMRREVVYLKELTAQPDLSVRQRKEMLIRLLYCEMLGHDVAFGHIQAVKFAQQNTVLEKRVGYLVTSLFLHENHELTLLLVNSLQKDLKSTNVLDVCAALVVICKLISADLIPAFLPLVVDKAKHSREIVRKKAVMTLHCFLRKAPSSVTHLEDTFRQLLCDRDPGVMSSALFIFHDLIQTDPSDHTDLVGSFVSILKQIIERRLPQDFDYHNMPAPWVQMKLLRILAMLGADDLKASEGMYTVLEEALMRADIGSPIGYAVTYECIRTITSIYPNSALVHKAAAALSRFLTSHNNNYKYFGITLLGSIIQVNPKYAADHQLVVIDCLDDPDETLKRKTLDLLYRMTNPHNVEVICERLVGYLRSTVDNYLRTDLVARITELAERFAPDNSWFMHTLNAVFELGGSLVRPEVAHNLMRLIAEGTEDEDQDLELRLHAVTSYMELIDKPQLPDILIEMMSWVLGEYSYLSGDYEPAKVLEKLCNLLEHPFENPATRSWVVTAIMKLVSQEQNLPASVWAHVSKYMSSASTDLQQRCYELKMLATKPHDMAQVLPVDSSCEDLELDGSLSFLDEFVSDALARGCVPYKPASQRRDTLRRSEPEEEPSADDGKVLGLNIKPYDAPTVGSSLASAAASSLFAGLSGRVSPVTTAHATAMQSTEAGGESDRDRGDTASTGSAGSAKSSPQIPRQTTLEVSGPRMWGRGGYAKKQQAVATLPIAPTESSEVDGPSEKPVSPRQPTSPHGKTMAVVSGTAADGDGNTAVSEEEARKLQLAGQLFGGVAAGRGAGVLTGKGKARPRARKAVASTGSTGTTNTSSADASASNASGSALLDFSVGDDDGTSSAKPSGVDSSSAGMPAAAAAPAAAPSSAANLLMDLDWLSSPASAPVQANQPAPVMANTASSAKPAVSSSDLDLLGSLDLSSGVSVPSSVVQTSSTGSSNQTGLMPSTTQSSSSSSPFDFLMGSSTSSGATELPVPMTAGGSARLPEELSHFPHSSKEEDVCVDVALRATACRVWQPDALVFVFFLFNQRTAPLSNVTTQLEPPSCFQAQLTNPSSPCAWKDDLDGSAMVRHIVSLTGKTLAKTMSLRGELSYREGSSTASKRQFFTIPIELPDILRPLAITTEQFGGRWGSASHERKLKIASSLGNLASYMDCVKMKLNIHPVQIIGHEAIAAGTLLGGPVCLLHAKLVSNMLELWIKSSSSLLIECLAQFAPSALQ